MVTPTAARSARDARLDDQCAVFRASGAVDIERATHHVDTVVTVVVVPLERGAVVELGDHHPDRGVVGAHAAAPPHAVGPSRRRVRGLRFDVGKRGRGEGTCGQRACRWPGHDRHGTAAIGRAFRAPQALVRPRRHLPGQAGARIRPRRHRLVAVVAQTVPRCRSTVCLTIARPRPEPGSVRASTDR